MANRLIPAQPLAARIDTLSVTCALLRRWLECGVKRDFRCIPLPSTATRESPERPDTRSSCAHISLGGVIVGCMCSISSSIHTVTRDRGWDRAREPRCREVKRGGAFFSPRPRTYHARRRRGGQEVSRGCRCYWAFEHSVSRLTGVITVERGPRGAHARELGRGENKNRET